MKEEKQEVSHVAINREGDTVIYDVPVVRHIWEKTKEGSAGLKDKIRQARTATEVNALLEKGTAAYKNASSGTVAKWKRVAERRIKELESVVEKPKKRYSKKY